MAYVIITNYICHKFLYSYEIFARNSGECSDLDKKESCFAGFSAPPQCVFVPLRSAQSKCPPDILRPRKAFYFIGLKFCRNKKRLRRICNRSGGDIFTEADLLNNHIQIDIPQYFGSHRIQKIIQCLHTASIIQAEKSVLFFPKTSRS